MDEESVDLMSFLLQEYVKAFAEHKIEKNVDDIKPFISFANTYLTKNQPVGITYLTLGLGLRMAEGQLLALVPQEAHNQNFVANNNAVMVTKPKEIPGMRGIMPDITSISVTKG